jgi:hypothetical protein
VDDLFAMDIFKGVTDFTNDLLSQVICNFCPIQEFFKCLSVNPFHHNTAADGRVLYLCIVLAYVRMVEGESDVEVLGQQVLVHEVAAILFLEGFIDKESTVLAGTIQTVEPSLRCVDEFNIVAVVYGISLVCGKKES